MRTIKELEEPQAFTNGTASASVVALLAAVATGDWLLWTNYPALSVVIFLASLAGLQAALNWQTLDRQRLIYAGNLLMLGLAPLLETINALTAIIGLAGTFAACLILRDEVWLTTLTRWPERLDAFVTASLISMSRFPILLHGAVTGTDISKTTKSLRVWLWPIFLALGFAGLFAIANPVLENWLEAIDVAAILSAVFSPRLLFWLLLLWLCWPFVESRGPVFQGVRWAKFGFDVMRLDGAKAQSKQAISVAFFKRSLILFNLVFAAQTLLDITYLWAGMSLPEGMSYAEYAHRGAYPLVVAALLAAVFVLIAMRPGGPGERSALVKWLVLAWVAQNVLLVGSSVLRLDLYVAAYALTYWRISAFVWMGLVAAGLILIVLRFVLNRSTGWLVTANVGVLAIVLYGMSFVNVPSMIARYNLEHSSLAVAGGSTMDYHYLQHLGAHAYPAIAKFIDENQSVNAIDMGQLLRVSRKARQAGHMEVRNGWRAWNWRRYRLENALKTPVNGVDSPSNGPLSHWSGRSRPWYGADSSWYEDTTSGSVQFAGAVR